MSDLTASERFSNYFFSPFTVVLGVLASFAAGMVFHSGMLKDKATELVLGAPVRDDRSYSNVTEFDFGAAEGRIIVEDSREPGAGVTVRTEVVGQPGALPTDMDVSIGGEDMPQASTPLPGFDGEASLGGVASLSEPGDHAFSLSLEGAAGPAEVRAQLKLRPRADGSLYGAVIG